MKPTARLARLIDKEVARQSAQFSELWVGYDEPANTVSPHRQRTAINKLLGYALFLGMSYDRASGTGKSLRSLKTWQRIIGPLRDIDVVREWVAKCAEAAGPDAKTAAAAFDQELLARRAKTLADVRLALRGLPGAHARIALQRTMGDFRDALATFVAEATSGDTQRSLRRVSEPWLLALGQLEETQDDLLLHGFRVKNKKLRFVLETLAEEHHSSALGVMLADRAELAARVHTTLGNLSDLAVVKRELRLLRAKWAVAGRGIDTSADALEHGRTLLEAAEFSHWFAAWPRLRDEAFLGQLLSGH